MRPPDHHHRRAHGLFRLGSRWRGRRARGGPEAPQGRRRLRQDRGQRRLDAHVRPEPRVVHRRRARGHDRRGAPPRHAHRPAESVQNCLDAGVDMIIHCIFNEADGTYRFRPDLVERLVAAKAWVNPTLYVMKAGIDRLREAREREGRLTPDLVAQLEQSQRALDVRVDAVRQMTEAGVRMTAGSDSPWGWYAPGEFVHEIHMLARAGLSYADAIVAGTSGAAESIGVGALAGRLLPGRPADVLVVRGDPTGDIAALWDVLDVYQAGRRIERGLSDS
ncbi:MAG: hypothetical protein DMD83_25125 [Candidatus Rokuibacteriota bacterium]|nr:MAG: hypothetical protein DMD83_25125 [Candidatus Rokubacteria bacterium]